MIELVTYFRALADASRLRLLALMAQGPQSVENLAVALGVPQPKVSRHLAYLRRMGLVEGQRDGRRIFYRIVEPDDGFARRIMTELQQKLQRQPAIVADRRRLKKNGP